MTTILSLVAFVWFVIGIRILWPTANLRLVAKDGSRHQ